MRFDIKLVGSGGQGILLASIVLGTAATIFDGKNAVTSSNYGPEARGGEICSDVIISDREIYYPKVIQPNVLLAMSDGGYKTYKDTLKTGGIILVDEVLVKFKPQKNVFSIPATEIAENLGSRIVANMIMLGLLAKVTKAVSLKALTQATIAILAPEIPEKMRSLNLKALKKGYTHFEAKKK